MPPAKPPTTEARALVDIEGVGKCGSLVVVDSEQVAGLLASGMIDTDPGAVAYAKSLAAGAEAPSE